MTYLFRSRENVLCIEDLEKTEERKCGSTINIQRVLRVLHDKLFRLIGLVHLQSIAVRETFSNANDLSLLFLTIGNNRKIKKELELDVRNNPFNKNCGIELTKLICRRLFKKLELPPIEDPYCCEDILREIQACGGRIEVLNISGSFLTELSIDCLANSIRERIITDQLVLRECMALGHALTKSDHDKLKGAEKQTRRMFGMVKMLSIFWFDYVESAELDIEDLNHQDYEIVALPPPPMHMPGIVQVAYYMIKKRIGKSNWKLVHGRKRRQETTTSSKVRIQEAEFDDLANLMGKSTIDRDTHQTQRLYAYEYSQAPNYAGPMEYDSGPSTSSRVQSEQQSFISQESQTSPLPGRRAPEQIPYSGRRTRARNTQSHQDSRDEPFIRDRPEQHGHGHSIDRGAQIEVLRTPQTHSPNSNFQDQASPSGMSGHGQNAQGAAGYFFPSHAGAPTFNFNINNTPNQNATATQIQGATSTAGNKNHGKGARRKQKQHTRGSVSETPNELTTTPGGVELVYDQLPERDNINSTEQNFKNKGKNAKKNKGFFRKSYKKGP